MAILTRYVVSEILKLLAVALLALTAVLSVSMAGKEAVRQGIPPLIVLQSMPFFVLQMLGYALPASVLYAVCSVFGRMSAAQELTALKSVGVDPRRMIEPALVVTVVISLAAVVTYDLTAVWGRPGVRRLLADSAADIALGALRARGSVSLPWGAVHVRGVDGNTLIRPCIRLNTRDETAKTLLVASRGELRSDETGVRLVLSDFEADVGDEVSISHPGVLELPLPQTWDGRPVHRDWLAMSEIADGVREIDRRRNRAIESLGVTSCSDRVAQVHKSLDRLDWKQRRLNAEPHRRWANGFSCLAFALVGIPVALLQRNADAISTFFVAFLPVLVVFYPLLMTSESLALSGWFPGWVFWMADAVLAGAGVFLLRRALRR